MLLSASLFPFFFEQTVGLVSLGSPLGAIVAYNASLGAGHRVIRAAGLGGLPGGTAVDCADGVLVAGVVDFHAKQSPMLLLAVDLQHGGVWRCLAQRNSRSAVCPDAIRFGDKRSGVSSWLFCRLQDNWNFQ